MKGEDKIFLLQVIQAVRMGGEHIPKFFTDANIDRLVRIKDEVGAKGLDEELIKLRKVVYACD